MSRPALSVRSHIRPFAACAALVLCPLSTSAAILEVYEGSLTTYLPSAASAVQDIRPLAIQRAVHLDGTLVAGPTVGVRVNGNPFGSPWNGRRFVDSIRLDIGAYTPTDVDISLPATVPWVIGRTYNGRQATSGGSSRHSNGYQGVDWFQTSQPEIVLYEHPSDDTQDVLYILWGADRYIELERLDDGEETPTAVDLYKAVNGAAGVVEFVEGDVDEPDVFVYTDPLGTQVWFFGFDGDAGSAAGQIWKIVGTGGDVAYVGDATTGSTAISSGYSGGKVTTAYDSAGRRFSYSYTSIDSTDRLTQVTADEYNGLSWQMVGRVHYDYYQTGDTTYGNSGCLKLVRQTVPLSQLGSTVAFETLYRYDTTTTDLIELVVGPEGCRRYDWEQDGDLSDDDFESASTADLKPYADLYMTYNGSLQIASYFTTGACGCSGHSAGTINATYGLQSGHPASAGYDEERYAYALLEHPDGHYELQWVDELGGPLTHVLWLTTNPFGTDGSAKTWIRHVERYATAGNNPGGSIHYITKPSACGGWNNTYATYSVNLSALNNSELVPYTGGDDLDGQPNEYWPNLSVSDARVTALTDENSVAFTSGTVTLDLVRPRVDTRSDVLGNDTVFDYTYYTAAGQELREKIVETIHAAVSTGANGPNTTLSSFQYMRPDGTLAFTQTTDGVFSYTKVEEGLVTERRQDALLTGTFPSGDDPNGDFGITEVAGGLDLVTTFAYDAQGRVSSSVLPSGRNTRRYYTKLEDGRLVTLSIPRKSGITYYGPVTYTVANHAGKVEGRGVIALSGAGGSTTTALSSWISTSADDDPIAAVNGGVGTLERWATTQYNESGVRIEEQRAYFNIPASGVGTSSSNYDPTFFEYDDCGRRVRVEDATGTITRTVYDEIGRAIGTDIGTDDSGTGSDNMVTTSEIVYDGGADDKDSLVTLSTLYVVDGTAGKREFSYLYDTLGRQVVRINPQAPHEVLRYDDADRVVARGLYGNSSGLTASTNPLTTSTNRVALTETAFDELGRVWKSTQHEVDPSSGTLGSSLLTESWYDSSGRLAKRDGAALTKTVYNSLGWPTNEYTLASDNDSTYAMAVDGPTDDVVLMEHQIYYEPGTTKALMHVYISRFHDDTSSTGALDIDTDLSSVDQTGTPGSDAINGRVQIVSYWYDDLDRLTEEVRLGTYGGADYDRDSFGSAHARSPTALRTTMSYNKDGTLSQSTDPAGSVTQYAYDDLGRQTSVIQNYVDGTPGNGTGDDDRKISYGYTDGLRTSYVANLPGGDQTTTYSYAASANSEFSTNRLLTAVTYPDSGSVAFGRNAQGEIIYFEDQAGNVIEGDYDTGGRETARRVTNVETGFDDAVLAIRATYTSLGQLASITQYDDPSSTSPGDVVDQLQFSYDGWGNIETLDQDFNSTIAGDYWRVTNVYETETSGRNTRRITQQKLLYAGSTEKQKVEYSYGANNSIDDNVSRVAAVSKYSGPLTVAEYAYLGVGQLVGIEYVQPSDDVFYRLYGSTSGSYPGLDRFDRTVSSVWSKDVTNGPIDFYDDDVSYDELSNVTLVEDHVYAGRDISYTINGLNQLEQADEGTWGGSSISSQTRQEVWELSHVGNWDVNKLDLDGDLDYSDAGEFNVAGTFDSANAQTGRGSDTFLPDDVGNFVDNGNDQKFVYDVFRRLRAITDQRDNLIAQFRYNGLGQMIAEQYDSDGDSTVETSNSNDDDWRYFVYTPNWQVLAVVMAIDDGAGLESGEYLADSDDDPKELFVHHAAGLDGLGGSSAPDAIILRDADVSGGWHSPSDGTLEHRMYYCQNWRGDVVNLLDETGARRESARYFAYGMPCGLPRADLDGDGDVDYLDNSVMTAAFGTSVGDAGYNVKADIDLDGDVDSTDSGILSGDFGQTLGRSALSRDASLAGGVGNRFGYAGYLWDDPGVKYQVRHRWLDPLFGRWLVRDFIEYADGSNLYQYASSDPISRIDPTGLLSAVLTGYCVDWDGDGDPEWCTSDFRTNTFDFRAPLPPPGGGAPPPTAGLIFDDPEFKSTVWVSRCLGAEYGKVAKALGYYNNNCGRTPNKYTYTVYSSGTSDPTGGNTHCGSRSIHVDHESPFPEMVSICEIIAAQLIKAGDHCSYNAGDANYCKGPNGTPTPCRFTQSEGRAAHYSCCNNRDYYAYLGPTTGYTQCMLNARDYTSAHGGSGCAPNESANFDLGSDGFFGPNESYCPNPITGWVEPPVGEQ